MALSPELRAALIGGAEKLDVTISVEQQNKLIIYLEQMVKWNSSYNLSAIRDPMDMLSKHLLDSLSVVNIFAESSANRIIDVGTGGGLPGIPLAIMFPHKSLTLLDSAGKKTRFLLQLAHNMSLKNVNIENRRVENYVPDEPFDIVVSRAFADIKKMLACCAHLVAPEGEFWAMKGVFPEDELSDLAKHYKVKSCTQLTVPGNACDSIGERCLVKIQANL